MSADNFIGVVSLGEGEGWLVHESSMSFLCENEQACIDAMIKRGGHVYADHEEAIHAAFAMEQSTAIVEYGIMDL